MPALALLAGIAFGLGVSLNDPTLAGSGFAAGAMLCGLWLIAAPRLVIGSGEPRWLEIASRIFASWLIAIGLMLGALQVLPLGGY
jgi:hypothetical protein